MARDAREIQTELDNLVRVDDALITRINSLAAERTEIGDTLAGLRIELTQANKIPDSIAWVNSFTRPGAHLTVVINGKGFCTCEDAQYRNRAGGCKHFNVAVANGRHDPRAAFCGGFDGPVDFYDRFTPSHGQDNPAQFVYDALVGVS